MRFAVSLLFFLALTGCTALVVGGAAVGAYQLGKDERPAEVVATDTTITGKIKAKYVADSIVSVFNIGVHTYEGVVTLTGTVGGHIARDQAYDLARHTSGVKTVTNQIVVGE